MPRRRHFRPVVPVLSLLALAAGKAAAQAKVEEQIVAPNEQYMSYFITTKGSHLAAVVQKGSRWAVSFDGVVGPTFDVILAATGGKVAFSPDGNRFAYTARSGSEYVVMVDGKEVKRGPIGNNLAMAGGAGFSILFTPNSKHWFYHFQNQSATDLRTDPPYVVWDGVAGPPGAEPNVTVSPNGERHAYIVRSLTNANQWVLVVDGKPAPGIGSNPQFSADGAHLFTTHDIAVQGKPAQEILVDGRPIMRVEQAVLYLPPAGNQFVARVLRRDPNGMDAYYLVAGGKRVVGSESSGYRTFSFSADGMHWATIAAGLGPRKRVIVDGKVGQEYDMVDSVAFTPDGKAVYTARSGSKVFVVIDGTESEVGFNALNFLDLKSTKAGRIGWVGETGQGAVAVVDGKLTRLPARAFGTDVSFSPDGSRFAYFVSVAGQPGGNVTVDQVPGASNTLQPFVELRSGAPTHYIWSPDSRFTVHQALAANGDYGFVIGGKFLVLPKTGGIAYPTFTPDSRHLFWLSEDGRTEMLRVYLDGKQVFESDLQGRDPLKTPGAWEVAADGTLTFFVQTVEGFKRVRITPGADNGFEAWLATGKALR